MLTGLKYVDTISPLHRDFITHYYNSTNWLVLGIIIQFTYFVILMIGYFFKNYNF